MFLGKELFYMLILTQTDVVALASEFRIHPVLMDNWYRSTGSNPFMVAKELVEDKKKKRRIFRFMFYILIAELLIICTLPFLSPTWQTVTMLTGSIGVLVMIGIGNYLTRQAETEKMRPIMELAFPEYLANFIEWSGKTVDQIALMYEKEIKKIGETILVKQASAIIRLQTANAKVPPELWRKQDEGRLVQEFDRRYQVLKNFGLASGPYGPYFDEARRLIEIETQSTPSAQSTAPVTSPVPLTTPAARLDDCVEIHVLSEDKMIERIITGKKRISIGRNSDNDVVLDNRSVDRKHAMIEIYPKNTVIIDYESLNGTFVNERHIEEEILHDGDRIKIGKYVLIFNPLAVEPTAKSAISTANPK